MNNVVLEDVIKHYLRTHTSSNMRFVIAGNFTPSRREIIENAFADIDLPKGHGRRELPDESRKIWISRYIFEIGQ